MNYLTLKDDEFSDGIYAIMESAEFALQLQGEGGYSVSNGVRYKNEVFETNPYSWGDCTCEGDWPGEFDHEEGCTFSKPNFHHYASGLKVVWYKHVGRDTESNTDVKVLDWYRIVVECIESIRRDVENG